VESRSATSQWGSEKALGQRVMDKLQPYGSAISTLFQDFF
jgi:hypothetical protein